MVASALRYLRQRAVLIMAGALGLAIGCGFLTSQALGTGDATKTVTITLSNGATGPVGPRGPQGEPGSTSCPNGYEAGALVINHPGGQVTIWTCLKG